MRGRRRIVRRKKGCVCVLVNKEGKKEAKRKKMAEELEQDNAFSSLIYFTSRAPRTNKQIHSISFFVLYTFYLLSYKYSCMPRLPLLTAHPQTLPPPRPPPPA